jgi:superkiller protein 3
LDATRAAGKHMVGYNTARLLVIVVFSCAALHADDTGQHLNRGLLAAQKGDCPAAVVELKAALDANPTLVPALNALGVCQDRLGDPEQASKAFEQVINLDPSAWQGWNNLGAHYLTANQPQRAAEAFRKAVELDSHASSAWFNLGSALARLGAREEAFEALDRAQQLAPKDPEITTAWLEAAGRLATEAADCVNKKEYERARERLLKVARPLAESPSWNNLLGYVEFKLGHPEDAIAHLQKALHSDPNNEDYLLDLGEFLAYYRAYGEARKIFEIGAKRMPHSPRVQFGLAVSYILEARRPEAIASLRSLIASNPKFEAAYHALGECYQDSGQWDDMARLGKALQELNPSNAMGWYLEGSALLQLADSDRKLLIPAISDLKRASVLNPSSGRFHFALAKAYREDGKFEEAVAELKETLRLDPEHERAHYVLGLLYQQLGQSELARQELNAHSKIKEREREAGYRLLLKEVARQ